MVPTPEENVLFRLQLKKPFQELLAPKLEKGTQN